MIGIYSVSAIQSLFTTLQITRAYNGKDQTCSFQTRDALNEFDELIVEDDYGTRLFAGIVEKPTIDKTSNLTVRSIVVSGYKRIFDRARLNTHYVNQTLAYIVTDIVTNKCPDFTLGHIDASIGTASVTFNYEAPSDAIRKLCDALGYVFEITFNKVVNVYPQETTPAAQVLDDATPNRRSLKFTVDTSNYCNSVIVRGGTYPSTNQTFSFKGDGAMRQFPTPYAPSTVVSITVNGVDQGTVTLQTGSEVIPTAWGYNPSAGNVLCGTATTPISTDTVVVTYQYLVPLRVRRDSIAAIAKMRQLFPETDGIFQRVVNEKTYTDYNTAAGRCDQELQTYSNPVVDGSFITRENAFNPGDVVSINVSEFTGTAVVMNVQSKNLGGNLFEHTVKLSSVLFDVVDFMRKLLDATKAKIDDAEDVEQLYDMQEVIDVTETVTVSTNLHRESPNVSVHDENYNVKNTAKLYVLGPYFPSSYTDTKRQFCLGGGLLS